MMRPPGSDGGMPAAVPVARATDVPVPGDNRTRFERCFKQPRKMAINRTNKKQTFGVLNYGDITA
jgi:hypothetical protein